MKKIIKKHIHIFTVFSVALFMFLHFQVYRETDLFQDFGFDEIPVLQNYVDPPLEISKLSFCESESSEPSYINPFGKVKYFYQEKLIDENGETTYGECNLSEIQKNYFSHQMEPVGWKVEDYWLGYDAEGFTRPLVPNNYPTIIFFIVQYSLLYFILIYLRKLI